MIKLNIKVEGLDKLESELRKEGDKLIKEELRKQQAKHQEIGDDADPLDSSPDVGRLNSDVGRLDCGLEIEAFPPIMPSPKVSSSPKISSDGSSQKKP